MEELEALVASDYRGPKAGFNEAHVLKAIQTIGNSGKVGRGKLGSLLNLGQGEVRTLIRRLKDASLITIEERGCELTALGRKEFTRLSKLIPWSTQIDGKSLRLGEYAWAVNVRGKSSSVKKGIEQRDAAIIAGAQGALTVVYSGGKFVVPPDEMESEGKNLLEPWAKIRSLGMSENDVLIICGSGDLLSAEYGALSAALTLI